ncbi:hypothetical protein [Nonomuraea turcica]|uniref:hypothetical protein n=1 Tax=Nonomuraea sp. G32 TaxID=3067274 RepID=UPI00273C0DE4|nr:hypothetical protein [Nonomuraea sp. G32]MDP4501080.1 hypothetical protein [Nonomuraea sp. G32]
MILDRDGAVVADAEVLTEVEWSRVLDDTSTAKVVITPGGDCCERLKQVRSWRHRLAIWRDGDPVWEGPILQAEWSVGQVEINAGDVLAWLDRRVPHETITFHQEDLTTIAQWLIADGFLPDDPGHQVQVIGPPLVRGDRAYEQDVGQTGDHLRDLADTGLDYTAVGSVIVLLPEDHTASVGSLTDADLPEGLTVAEDGVALATRWVVHGDEVKGEAGGRHDYYGLLERSVEENSIKDTGSARAAARSRLRGSLPAPVWISSERVTLSPEAAVDVPKLVPGWCVDVTTTATCRTIGQRLKIAGVKVTENAEGESVQLQLAPTGAGLEGA